MAMIRDVDRTVFSNAHKTVQNNFTQDELERIGKLATELKAILDAATERQNKSSPG